jgi:hypothetical protein|tara:strand:+ start:1583 stop:1996 length:414 start_codon:yes stop_codon:yes gene_type:complete
MNKYLFEVMQEVAKAKKKTDKVSILKQNETWALKDIIRGSMDKTVKWSLPDGEPPYTPAESHNHPTDLRRQNVKFKYFVQGMFMDTPKFKKERMFLEMIEGVHPEDAKLVIGMINKETPKGITRAVVEEAYPGLLQD